MSIALAGHATSKILIGSLQRSGNRNKQKECEARIASTNGCPSHLAPTCGVPELLRVVCHTLRQPRCVGVAKRRHLGIQTEIRGPRGQHRSWILEKALEKAISP